MAYTKVGDKGEGDEGEWHKVEELEGKRERQSCKVKGERWR